MITFNNLWTYHSRVEDRQLYCFYGQELTPASYSYNYCQLNFNPKDDESLALLENQYLDFAYDLDLLYYAWHWPENTGILPSMMRSLARTGYLLELNRLMVLSPENFEPGPALKEPLSYQLSDQASSSYLAQQFAYNQEYSHQLANDMACLYTHYQNCDQLSYLSASYQGQPAAVVDLIDHGGYWELDNFTVTPNFRGLGIGSELLQIICQLAKPNQQIILRVDQESPAYQFYMKRGFTDHAYQIRCHRPIPQTIRQDIKMANQAWQQGQDYQIKF
ncbi:hypothetical protein AWM75_04020 [Aerococcus urinaehominis]|uniref:Uncharacterized protein n=1 Tax=Aerococcus urinaehominis TaxID=128944 RepID=A0A0X8FKY2_9LACT|nr:GNAT family N-acetyltransferase [Aerococcus urinaehominis]AMB99223.1 hypothetical protein AWM75_04020 [Aerococcus urinaehominis]SDM31892.1 Acetyltransferase (GNAT) domain-containing protein [Aerococcus urinaehominis]